MTGCSECLIVPKVIVTGLEQRVVVCYADRNCTYALGESCQMTGVNSPGLLTVADAAAELSRSTEQVRRYLREGRLRGRRIGGQWFIEEGALTTFREALNDQSSYLDKLRPASQIHALDGVIGIGHGGGRNIAEGKDSYRRSSWWRR